MIGSANIKIKDESKQMSELWKFLSERVNIIKYLSAFSIISFTENHITLMASDSERIDTGINRTIKTRWFRQSNFLISCFSFLLDNRESSITKLMIQAEEMGKLWRDRLKELLLFRYEGDISEEMYQWAERLEKLICNKICFIVIVDNPLSALPGERKPREDLRIYDISTLVQWQIVNFVRWKGEIRFKISPETVLG